MRFITFNIHGWRAMDGTLNLDRVADVLTGCNADIVGLNEVFHPQSPDPSTGLSKESRPLLDLLAERLGFSSVFGPVLRWSATDEMPERSYGNGLLSRYPIIASASHRLTPVADKEDRGLLEGRILLPSKKMVTVYVTHLDHTDEEARLIQLRALRSWTGRDRRRDHILMGDFNAVQPEDYTHRDQDLVQLGQHARGSHMAVPGKGARVIPALEKAGYVDTMILRGSKGLSSYIPADEDLRIDYIWVSQTLAPRVDAAGICQEEAGAEASDHRPVWADVDLEEDGSL